jgi:hypothetical protein
MPEGAPSPVSEPTYERFLETVGRLEGGVIGGYCALEYGIGAVTQADAARAGIQLQEYLEAHPDHRAQLLKDEAATEGS